MKPPFKFKLKIDQKSLGRRRKRKQQKYLVLLSNQQVVIGSEWDAMKIAVKIGKPIIEMQKTDSRVNDQVTDLSKLLESLERRKEEDENDL